TPANCTSDSRGPTPIQAISRRGASSVICWGVTKCRWKPCVIPRGGGIPAGRGSRVTARCAGFTMARTTKRSTGVCGEPQGEPAEAHAAVTTPRGHQNRTQFTELELYPTSSSTDETRPFNKFMVDVKVLLPNRGKSQTEIQQAHDRVVMFIVDSRNHLDTLLA